MENPQGHYLHGVYFSHGEGHCELHLCCVSSSSSYFVWWGTHYDHSNEEVHQILLDFAVQKLLCGWLTTEPLSNAQMYTVLSQRLVLDINTPQYLFNSESPLDAMQTMHEQIANHMHVCVVVRAGIESLRGVASSEPILLEAVSCIMLSQKILLASCTFVGSDWVQHQPRRSQRIIGSRFLHLGPWPSHPWKTSSILLLFLSPRTFFIPNFQFDIPINFGQLAVPQSHWHGTTIWGHICKRQHVLQSHDQAPGTNACGMLVPTLLHGTWCCHFGHQLSTWIWCSVSVLVQHPQPWHQKTQFHNLSNQEWPKWIQPCRFVHQNGSLHM